MEQRNTNQGGRSSSAATFPLLLLILIDSMGFCILTPFSPALWPQNQTPRFAEVLAGTIAILFMDLPPACIQ